VMSWVAAGRGDVGRCQGRGAVAQDIVTRYVCPQRVSGRSAVLTYIVVVDPVRLTIQTCVGCGSMREFESCVGTCRERKLELVSGGDYDELATAAAAWRIRIRELLPVVEKLVSAEPRQPDWRGLYESLRERTRLVLRAAGQSARAAFDEAASSAETTVVWRCPDCGGLEATQPCIGVCIWRPLDWVEACVFESERAQVLRDVELERSLFVLLTRFARVTPRDGEWECNWRAFGDKARHMLGSQSSGGLSSVIVLGEGSVGV
jgi:hypothetical protein